MGPTSGGDLLRATTRCALLSVAAIATSVLCHRSRQAPKAYSCSFALLLLSGTALLAPRAGLVLQGAVVRREPPRLALCYWGLTRSTQFVHISHEQHIFGALRAANVSYRTFMHTWALSESIGEIDMLQGVLNRVPVNKEEWQLLHPHAFRCEPQRHFVQHSINRSALDAWGRSVPHGNAFRSPEVLRNHLCSLESLRRVHHLAVSSGFVFTHAVFLRPDAWISTDLPLHALPPPGKVVLPSRGNTGGWNDQFAMLHAHTAPVYARRVALAPAYWSQGKPAAHVHRSRTPSTDAHRRSSQAPCQLMRTPLCPGAATSWSGMVATSEGLCRFALEVAGVVPSFETFNFEVVRPGHVRSLVAQLNCSRRLLVPDHLLNLYCGPAENEPLLWRLLARPACASAPWSGPAAQPRCILLQRGQLWPAMEVLYSTWAWIGACLFAACVVCCFT